MYNRSQDACAYTLHEAPYPLPAPKIVTRPRLIERLNVGEQRKLTLISAPAGFGKTTLISEWIAGCDPKVAWLSLPGGS